MSLESNLASMEKSREVYWLKYQSTAPIKLRWRAVTVRHCFHVLPGERILELQVGAFACSGANSLDIDRSASQSFGANSANNLSKRGSCRSGSHNG
jgi:hypothetical protein